MVLFHRILVLLLLLRISSSCFNSWLSKLRVKKYRHSLQSIIEPQVLKPLDESNRKFISAFDQLASLIITNQVGTNDFIPTVTQAIDAERDKITSAATIMLAIVLSNGLVEPSDCEALRSVENGLANADASTIATILAKYVVPVFDKDLVAQYQTHLKSGYSPVKSMGFALEGTAVEGLLIQEILKERKYTMGCWDVI